jgi:hypothetical protein
MLDFLGIQTIVLYADHNITKIALESQQTSAIFMEY